MFEAATDHPICEDTTEPASVIGPQQSDRSGAPGPGRSRRHCGDHPGLRGVQGEGQIACRAGNLRLPLTLLPGLLQFRNHPAAARANGQFRSTFWA